MVSLDFEHSPAGGTTLGVALTGFSTDILIALLTSVVILSLAHHFLRGFLRDLVLSKFICIFIMPDVVE